MGKAIDIILGIGIAIILFLFFMLAFKMVYPQPDYSECWNNAELVKPYNDNMTAEEQAEYNTQVEERQACQEKNDVLREDTEKKIFLSSVIVGIILVLATLFLLSMPNVAAGVGASGIALTVYGFAVGWESSGDAVKLIALLISAIVIIGLAVWYNKKAAKAGSKKKSKK